MSLENLFKKLLESEVLTEDSKKELSESLTTMVKELTETVKKETEDKVRLELTEQFVSDREKLIEALDTKAEEFFKKEIEELKEDIANFRDLEVEFAQKEVALKKQLQEQVKEDLKELVNQIDEYLEVTLNEEIEELRESIEEAKKNDLGMKIFESFEHVFRKKYVDENKVHQELSEANQELVKTEKELKKLKEEFKSLEHAKRMSEVLEPLAGNARQVMEALLKTQPVEKLQETYNRFIGKVLSESAVKETTHTQEKDEKVLAEGDKSEPVTEVKTVIKTGNRPEPVKEGEEQKAKVLDEAARNHLKRLTGLD
jgi:DNA repair exonuclease SbcCD ATPase subunit